MDYRAIYQEVRDKINNVDFSLLWKGFNKYKFAIYNDERVYFDGYDIAKTDDFLANTSIAYEGTQLAIWYLIEPVDTDVLASKLIHEMFHGFQREQEEKRFPDEFSALFTYEYEADLLQIKIEEAKLLCDALDAPDKSKLRKLCSLRAKRINTAQFEYESRVEQTEGSAQFVELLALKQICAEKYTASLNRLKQRILQIKNYFPIRIISYDIGALLLLALSNNGVAVNSAITDNDVCFALEMLRGVTPHEDIINISQEVEKAVIEDKCHLEALVEDALSNYEEKRVGNFKFSGVNVYSARHFKGYVYSEYFLAYAEENEQKVLYGNFLIKTDGKIITEIYRL